MKLCYVVTLVYLVLSFLFWLPDSLVYNFDYVIVHKMMNLTPIAAWPRITQAET